MVAHWSKRRRHGSSVIHCIPLGCCVLVSWKKTMGLEVLLPLIVLMGILASASWALENHIAGPPNVQCGADSISVSIPTKKPFLGRIFVKGLSKNPDCSRQFDNNTDSLASVELKFGSCGMNRERKLAPVPGLEESVTLIISFHYLFVTKIDRAYNIQCFFGQHNFATVTFGYNVSLMPTEMVQYGPRNSLHQMPSCTYDVRKGSLNGSLVQYAAVGDELWHKWSCGMNETEGRILVKNCYVAEGNGDRFLVIDSRGCAIDPSVISDLNYGENTTMAWVRTFAFKFADTPSIAFSCTIQVCFPGESDCDDVTPPHCSFGENSAEKIKSTRRLADSPLVLHDETDVSSAPFSVLDSSLHEDSRNYPSRDAMFEGGLDRSHARSHHPDRVGDQDKLRVSLWPASNEDSEEFCVSKMTFALVLMVALAVLAVFVVISVILLIALLRSKKEYHWRPSAWSVDGM